MELVPMFLNAMSSFAEEINVQDLSSFNIKGGNLKLNAVSKKSLTMAIFSSPLVQIDYLIEDIKALFDYFFDEYEDDFAKFRKTGNATKFLEFVPQARKELLNFGNKYKEIIKDLDTCNVEHGKELYAKMNKINENKFKMEEQLTFKSLKVKLLEAHTGQFFLIIIFGLYW